MILRRYMYRELLIGCALAFAIFSLAFFVGILFERVNKYAWLGLDFLLTVLPYAAPLALTYTVPAALLAGTIFVFGRMSHDNEISALQSSGVSLRVCLGPALALGAMASLVTYLCIEHLMPEAHYRQRNLTMKAIDSFVRTPRTGMRTFAIQNYLFHYDDAASGVLRGATVIRLDEQGRLKEKYCTPELRLELDEDKAELVFSYHRGTLIRYREENHEIEEDAPMLNDPDRPMQRAVSLAAVVRDRTKALEDMNLAELGGERSKVIEGRRTAAGDPGRLKDLRKRELDVLTEIHQRLSKSLAPLVFVIVGAPLGLLARKSNKLVLFGMTCLPVGLAYYAILLGGQRLALADRIDPAVGAWAPDAAVGALGLILLYRCLRH